MPLELILLGTSELVRPFITAASDKHQANAINKNTDEIVSDTKNRIEFSKNEYENSLKSLGCKKIDVINDNLAPFVKVVESLKNVDLDNPIGADKFDTFKIDKSVLTKINELVTLASSFDVSTTDDAINNTLSLFGAYNSTTISSKHNTDISLLTENTETTKKDSLAVVGEGHQSLTKKELALAIGISGLGLAIGSSVLGFGGLLLVGGYNLLVTGKARDKLENAQEHFSKAEEFKKEMEEYISTCNNIRRRAYSFYRLLLRLDAIFVPLISEVQKITENSGLDYFDYTPSQKKTLDLAASIASMIKAIVDTPILAEDGTLTAESEKIASDISALIEVA